MSVAFELPAELTIYGALETRDALLAWVTQHSGKSDRMLEISAKEVAEVDGSGLQLLAALSNMEVSWQLVEASSAFIEACRTLGLGHWVDSLPSSEA
ncbi:MAG: STAS domain-containing protein [Rhodoferax sp.]|jgi:ABC-type transporter Mla MlaB component|nr:STAS domain-containing protein [Rhodoferax sp.]